ncbi:MAG: PKD domain-containing protein [Oceanipulchritudo sp.]
MSEDAFRAFEELLGRYREASGKQREGMEAELLLRARARREAMREWIISDPREALARAVSYADRKGLPSTVLALLEKPVATDGQYLVSIACPVPGEHAAHGEDCGSHIERSYLLDGATYEVHTFGRRLDGISKNRLSAWGIAVDHLMAMADRSIRVLSPGEAADRGLEGPGIPVEMAGAYQLLEDEAAVKAWEVALESEESRPGPQPGTVYLSAQAGEPLPGEPVGESMVPVPDSPVLDSTYTEGAKTILYIRARFPEEAVDFEPITVALAQQRMDVVEDFWQNASYQKIPSATTTITDVVALPSSSSAYPNAFATLMSDARNAALAADPLWNYANYDFYIVVTSNYGNAFPYAGRGYVGAPGLHLRSDYTTLRTAGHELGHNLGLWHANYWRTDSTSPVGMDSRPGGYVNDLNDNEWLEYGHRFSLMSAQYESNFNDPGKPHFTVSEKVRLDWLTAADGLQVLSSTPVTGTVVRLYRQDHPAAPNTRAVQINVPSTDYITTSDSLKRRYWLSYRRAFNSGTPATHAPYGVEVDWQKPSYGNNGAIQLDMTPYTRNSTTYYNVDSPPGGYWTIDNTDKEDAMLPTGLTYSDPAGIHFTPIAYGDDDADPANGNEWIEVDVRLGTFEGNQPPEVSLRASNESPITGETVTFTASATDPDGDALSFWWDFGDLSVVPSALNNSTAAKSWSTAGVRLVRVVVSDRRGGQSIAMLPVTVGTPSSVLEIRGRVIHGGYPVAGARVNIGTTYQTWTDTDGRYILSGLPAASHTVSCMKDGLTFTAQFTNPVSTAAGNQYGKDFYANEPLGGGSSTTYSISGQVSSNGVGIAGIPVEAGGLRASTDSNGSYSITGLVNGSYTVVAFSPARALSPASRNVSINGADVSGQDFAELFYTVTGTVTGVPAGPQDTIPTVFLLNGVQADNYTRVNKVGWDYTITVPAGIYGVHATLPGYALTPSFGNPLLIDQNLSGMDFSGTEGGDSGSISGRVLFNGQALRGVALTAGGGNTATATTDSEGRYRFENLAAASTTITPSLSGFTFSPASLTVTPTTSGVDFSANGTAVSITDISVTPGSAEIPTDVTLSATATGTGPLSYRWAATTAPGPVSYSENDSETAASTTASLAKEGGYAFEVIVTDANGFTASESVNFTGSTSGGGAMVVTPFEIVVYPGEQVGYEADAFDADGNPLSVIPAWAAGSGGTIDSGTGLFTAEAAGTHTISATAGALTAEATITILPFDYIAWQGVNWPGETDPTIIDLLSDPEGDGIVNLTEFALGGNPMVADPQILPVIDTEQVGGLDHLRISINKNPNALGIDYVVEVSGDIVNWDSGAAHSTVISETDISLIVRDNLPMDPANPRFIRLKVLYP